MQPTVPSPSGSSQPSSPEPSPKLPSQTKSTTFALPPPTQSASSSAASSPLKPSSSILNRLGRKLSLSKTGLVRRVSLGAKNSPTASTSPRPTSPAPTPSSPSPSPPLRAAAAAAVAESPVASVQKGGGLRRSLRALGRSRSEGTATMAAGKRSRVPVEQVGRASPGEWDRRTPSERDPSQLFWEERLGICWDGREQVRPDLPAYEPYSSNSDVVPTRVVYASTLSTFPPRPPLRSRVDSIPPHVSTPASRVIEEYRSRHPLSPSHSSPSLHDDFFATAHTSESCTPIPTPRVPFAGDEGDGEGEGGVGRLARAGSIASLAGSDVSSSSDVPRFASASEDSSTSLESLGARAELGRKKAVTWVGVAERFSLADTGPVPARKEEEQEQEAEEEQEQEQEESLGARAELGRKKAVTWVGVAERFSLADTGPVPARKEEEQEQEAEEEQEQEAEEESVEPPTGRRSEEVERPKQGHVRKRRVEWETFSGEDEGEGTDAESVDVWRDCE